MRRHYQSDSSLELLLDTITNAFGGILFLALLVVVLLQNTSKIPDLLPKVSQAALAELRSRYQEIEAKVSALELEVEAREAIATNLADPTLESTLRNLSELRQARTDLMAEKSKVLESNTRLQEQLDGFDQKTDQLTAEIENTLEELNESEEKLEEERASRKINSPFPEERPATKLGVRVTIRYGKWYLYRLANGEPNLEDFLVLDNEGEYLTITPKPYRGLRMVERGKLSPAIIAYLRDKNPDREYVEISIWDDSFGEFQFLRDYMVERGFEYRLVVITEGDEVVEGYVPDPQVQ